MRLSFELSLRLLAFAFDDSVKECPPLCGNGCNRMPRRLLIVVTCLGAFKCNVDARGLNSEQGQVRVEIGQVVAILRGDLLLKARVSRCISSNQGCAHRLSPGSAI